MQMWAMGVFENALHAPPAVATGLILPQEPGTPPWDRLGGGALQNSWLA